MHDDSFVRIMKCRFCGKETNALALHKQLKPIREDVYDIEPCDKCKKLFETHKYFIGDCGHCGFISIEALQNTIDSKGLQIIGNSKIFRMEKCFICLEMIALKDCPIV